MFRKNKMEKLLLKNLEQLNRTLTKNNILEIAELLGNKKQLLLRNLLSGMAKGIGIGNSDVKYPRYRRLYCRYY